MAKPRDYKKEYKDYHGKPEQVANRGQRNKARAEAEAAGKVSKGDGKEVDHVKPIRKGGGNANNTRVLPAGKNRGWRGGKKGYD